MKSPTADRLRVIVFGQENLTNSFSVDGAGNIAMPLVGLVHAQGLTTAELAGAVEGKLRGGYLREPKVSVEVEAFRPFFVLGEVTVSGQYPFVHGMTVPNAIAIAGGSLAVGGTVGPGRREREALPAAVHRVLLIEPGPGAGLRETGPSAGWPARGTGRACARRRIPPPATRAPLMAMPTDRPGDPGRVARSRAGEVEGCHGGADGVNRRRQRRIRGVRMQDDRDRAGRRGL